MSNRNRAYYRKMRARAIKHKKAILRTWGNSWAEICVDGTLDKGKVHCSCACCSPKTKNKGHRRKSRWNYSPNINYKHSDQVKIERLEAQIKEYEELNQLFAKMP